VLNLTPNLKTNFKRGSKPSSLLRTHSFLGSKLFLLSFIALSTIVSGCDSSLVDFEGSNDAWVSYQKAPGTRASDLSQAEFALDDFGTLNSHTMETNAGPWKVYSVALLVNEVEKLGLPLSADSLPTVMRRYGFIVPESIANWETDRSPEPQFKTPIGLSLGMTKPNAPGLELQMANIGCTACHAGVTYDSQGLPTMNVWLGAPNTSINAEGYVMSIYGGLKIAAADPDSFMKKIHQVYPKMSIEESLTIKTFVMPIVKKKVKEFEATTDRPIPMTAGGPGLTNGVGALKFQAGLYNDGKFYAEAPLTSIPDLGNRQFRSSLLWDGADAPVGQSHFQEISRDQATEEHLSDLAKVAAFFTVPTAGASFASAEKNIPHVEEAAKFLYRYEAPRYPGKIDTAKAQLGSALFASRCSECHGTYSNELSHPMLMKYPNTLVDESINGTDPNRWQDITQDLLDYFKTPAASIFSSYVDVQRNSGYVAPLLSGVWNTAPYLHNGSVPTLWDFMHPETRPAKFMVGGHALDLQKVGINYPAGYTPWSMPVEYDTSELGKSNAGHEWQFAGLTDDQKWELIEYLKLL
jgi:mono/diheme cytochrome c family protein